MAFTWKRVAAATPIVCSISRQFFAGGSEIDTRVYDESGESGTKGTYYTRTIQKAIFSAEVPGDELLTEASQEDQEMPPVDVDKLSNKTPPKRPQLTEQTLGKQFSATEYEVLLGRIFSELLRDPEPQIDNAPISDFFVSQGLTASHWTKLKEVAKAAIGSRGLLDCVREMREIPLPAKVKTLADAEFCSTLRSGLTIKVDVVTWPDIAGYLLVKQYGNKFKMRQAQQGDLLDKLRTKVLPACDAPFQGIDFQSPALKTRIQAVIGEVIRHRRSRIALTR
jgi:hypothetical protein